jgi:trimethylamine--corrinoid protein Co-methyltransferase
MVNNTKHIETESTTTPEEARAQVQMASEVVGSAEELRKRHYISAMVCTISPLVLEGPATDAAMVWAENHVPIHITGMAMMGMSGPATIAGDIALNHAETLGLACAVQAHERGAPVIYGSVLSSMNPKTGSVNLSSVEAMILGTCASEMSRFVRFPCSCMGTGPGSMVPGPQAAIESSIITTLAAISGSEVMNGMGLLDSSTVLSYEQLMIDNEMVGMALSAFREIPVNKETLAAEIIEKVGIGGTFLKEMHTLRHIREFYVPSLWPDQSYDMWSKAGCKNILEVAMDKANTVLKEHKPEPLDKDISKRLDKIVSSFGKS